MSSTDHQGRSNKICFFSHHCISFQGEITKLQQHLALLRDEYVKLQQRYKTLERDHSVLTSTTKVDENSFVCRLLKIVAELFNKDLYRFK